MAKTRDDEQGREIRRLRKEGFTEQQITSKLMDLFGKSTLKSKGELVRKNFRGAKLIEKAGSPPIDPGVGVEFAEGGHSEETGILLVHLAHWEGVAYQMPFRPGEAVDLNQRLRHDPNGHHGIIARMTRAFVSIDEVEVRATLLRSCREALSWSVLSLNLVDQIVAAIPPAQWAELDALTHSLGASRRPATILE